MIHFVLGGAMSRFIVLSFLLLGWVFYEMSGGASFQTPTAPVIAAVEPQKARVARVETVAPVTITTRVQPDGVPTEPSLERTPDPATDTPTETANLDRVRTSLSQGLSLFPAAAGAQNLTLVSLEDGINGLVTTDQTNDAPARRTEASVLSSTVEPVADLREVTGTRVNMRDGPGTIYPVLARLRIGQQVEVLGDSGTGWLRLRTVADRRIGWISASLISKSIR